MMVIRLVLQSVSYSLVADSFSAPGWWHSRGTLFSGAAGLPYAGPPLVLCVQPGL